MPSSPIRLGPFDLDVVIGRGGMGEVWRGRHREQGVDVAVKVLTLKGTRDPLFLAAFRNEVRAVAGLDHPSIVMVLDHGQITPEAEEGSGGKLWAGSPYLAMELAASGSLSRLRGKLSWQGIRTTLLCILDALAHAHARGVIHRDLKPANVLLGGYRPGVKLTDFGLAEALDRETLGGGLQLLGTPAYMAPEQVSGRWRDYGPWTDLYALGCVAFELASGEPPFGNVGGQAVLNAHLFSPPPALRPVVPVPPGLAGWMGRLLGKDPRHRFRRAADAAWALAHVGQPIELSTERLIDHPLEAPPSDHEEPPSHRTPVVTAEMDALEAEATRAGPMPAPAHTLPISLVQEVAVEEPPEPALPRSLGQHVEPAPVQAPPLPESWRYGEDRPASLRLFGAGLSLYGLRALALVDREPERDALWAMLGALRPVGSGAAPQGASAHPTGGDAPGARVVLLRGPSGYGKSRLAEWFCERSHEVGAAVIVKAVHGSIPGPADGLRAALGRLLRCMGLTHGQVLQRLPSALRTDFSSDRDELHAMAELIAPATDADRAAGLPIIRFSSAAERHVLVRRTLERLGRERPVIVWIDDVQWGLESLAFVAHLLEAQDRSATPVLLVLTAREEALAERPAESALLSEILQRPGSGTIEVGPLPPEHRPALVRQLLCLEGELATQIEARTAGNPLFAVQLVGDWVHRGLLEIGPAGFRLRPGSSHELPDDLHQVWTARLAGVLEGRPALEGESLELAAVLGQEVDADEWRDACGSAGLPIALGLVEVLLAHRLARSGPRGPAAGWSFVHGMLRESLERRAQEAGRSRQYHRLCAETLKARGTPDRAERLGRHLLAAGEHEAAEGPLLEGGRRRIIAGDFELAESLLAERERALETLRLAPADPRWGAGWALRGRAAQFRGDLPVAEGWIDKAIAAGRTNGWDRVLVEALVEAGGIARLQGRLDAAAELFAEAERRAAPLAEPRLLAWCRLGVGQVHLRRGDLDDAVGPFEDARDGFEAAGELEGSAMASQALAALAKQAGRHRESAEELQRARDRFERCGSRWGVGVVVNDLAELDRYEGNLDAAEQQYREARTRLGSIGSGAVLVPELNLVMLLIQRGRHEEARRLSVDLMTEVVRRGRQAFVLVIHSALMACAAAAHDWPELDHQLFKAEEVFRQTRHVNMDVALNCRIAGDLARDAAEPDRASRAYALCRDQLIALGREVEAAEVGAGS